MRTHTSTLPTFEKGVPQADNAHSLITALQIKTPRARTLAHARTHTLLTLSLVQQKTMQQRPLFLPSDWHLPASAVPHTAKKMEQRSSTRGSQQGRPRKTVDNPYLGTEYSVQKNPGYRLRVRKALIYIFVL